MKLINYINFFFATVLGILLLLNIGVRLKSKEWEKIFWTAEIRSVAGNSPQAKTNIVKIIDGAFINTIPNSNRYFSFGSITSPIISAKSEKPISFGDDEKNLLPDSLSLKYFSIDERQFYQLSTSLPYERIKSIAKENAAVLTLEIQPKGKVVLKINTEKPQTIQEFTAQKTIGNLKLLISRTDNSDEVAREYEGIGNSTDFANLIGNQYKWSAKFETENQYAIVGVDAESFGDENIEIAENNEDVAASRNIPNFIRVWWEKGAEVYSYIYVFEPTEILNAFRKLDATNRMEPAKLTIRLKNDDFPECILSKNGVSIPLKDRDPEIPTKHER